MAPRGGGKNKSFGSERLPFERRHASAKLQ
jgi:hypothetical protein